MTSTVSTLRAETRSDSTDVATATPRLTWTTSTSSEDWTQAKAEIELDGQEAVETVGRDSVLVAWPFAALSPRQTASIRVRVTGDDGETSEWSEALVITAAFLAEGEWTAELVGLVTPPRAVQPALLRTEFEVRGAVRRATLYATAHGV